MSETKEHHRLMVLTSHPIQYQAPLFRRLAEHPRVDLTVYFCSDQGLAVSRDPEFGVSFKWDRPLLEGYSSRFLANVSPFRASTGLWRAINPGVVSHLWRGNFDAVLVHGYALATNWLGFAAARLRRTPILLHGETFERDPGQSGPRRWAKRAALGALFRQVAAFLPIGSKSVEFYESFGVSRERMFLTPYSVDNDFFIAEAERLTGRRDALKAELGIARDVPVCLYLSKLIPRKRPMDCLQAFEPLQDRAALVFVGDGERRPALEGYVRDRGIRNVHFMGFRNQSELSRFYALADVFLLPSAFETWGLVVNEAMCFGLPVVVADGAACSFDLVRDGENGYVVPTGDVATLAGRLETLVGDSELRRRMGRRSSEMIATWGHRECVDGIVGALDRVRFESKRASSKGSRVIRAEPEL